LIRVRVSSLEEAEADAVLRPVSSELLGVTAGSRAVELTAGAAVRERLEALGTLPLGGAVVTPGGGLRVEFLIHVVIQSAEEPVTEAGVRKALLNGLRRATEWGVETLAVPLLGAGAGNLEPEVAARIVVRLAAEHGGRHERPSEVTVVVANGYEEEAVRSTLVHLGQVPGGNG